MFHQQKSAKGVATYQHFSILKINIFLSFKSESRKKDHPDSNNLLHSSLFFRNFHQRPRILHFTLLGTYSRFHEILFRAEERLGTECGASLHTLLNCHSPCFRVIFSIFQFRTILTIHEIIKKKKSTVVILRTYRNDLRNIHTR